MKIEWKTPPDLFGTLNREFGFQTDVCALPWNAQCARFFTPETDGLAQPWEGVCWCNPPFDATQGRWVEKAWREAQRGATVVVIIPGNYHDSDWWHRYALRASEIRYMRGRPKFADEAGRETSMRMVVLVFRPHCKGPAVTASTLRDGSPNAHLSGGTPSAPSDCSQGD